MNKWLPNLFSRDRSSELGDPFGALQSEINRLFDDIGQWPVPRLRTGVPRLDMSESESELNIQIELPGMNEKDLDLLIEDDRLILRGKSEVEREDKERDYHIKERIAGAFERRLALPFRPDPAKVKARFAKGILDIQIEKTEEAKTHGTKVPIQAMS
ncbi:MAG: hypothetical protein RJA87_1437 [Pseudomonadota bacterium]